MKNRIAAATLGMVLSAPLAGHAETAGASQSEVEQLKAQVAMLLQRVEQLERGQLTSVPPPAAPPAVASPPVEERLAAAEETNDRQTDQIAQGLASTSAMDWARNIKWKGDIRYRHEQFDIEGTTSDRVRHRIRARLGMEAKISSTLLAGFQIATGEDRDARSNNTTLDTANENKEISLSRAYVDWMPRHDMLVTIGKQRQPWFKAGNSLFFDGDVEPEGVAFLYGDATGPFARAWGYWLEEQSSAADSNLFGAQLGYAFDNGLVLAAGYWDYGAIKDQPILSFVGTPAGNSRYSSDSSCNPSPTGLSSCYTYDYDIVIADAQWTGRAGRLPLMLFGGYMENLDPERLNTAYNLGFLLGKASDAGSWEFGALYQEVEQDAQLGAMYDSDFAGGLTQGRGAQLHGAWAPVRNMNIKATYFINDRSYDTASEADYERLQLDLNYKF